MPWQVWPRAGFPALGNVLRPTIIAAGVIAVLGTSSAEAKDGVDSEHLFGFTEGSDIGSKGERELKNETTLRLDKAAGSFAAGTSDVELKYTVADNFRVSAAATVATFAVSGLPALGDAYRGATQQASFSRRSRRRERNKARIGMTLSVEPHWGFVDETTGLRSGHFGAETALLVDRELVPDRLLGAFNIQFENDRVRSVAPGAVRHESILGSGLALTAQASPGLWLGAEARYLRSYDGAALNIASGQALYFGPTVFAALPNTYWLSVR